MMLASHLPTRSGATSGYVGNSLCAPVTRQTRVEAGGAAKVERLKPPQRQRKAPQTARGFTSETMVWFGSRLHLDPSAKADEG
jgi:hypothetical protein